MNINRLENTVKKQVIVFSRLSEKRKVLQKKTIGKMIMKEEHEARRDGMLSCKRLTYLNIKYKPSKRTRTQIEFKNEWFVVYSTGWGVAIETEESSQMWI